MSILFLLIAAVAGIVGLIGALFVIIAAFKDEIWKGILCLLCGVYWLYYALLEFDGDNKAAIILAAVGGSVVSKLCLYLAHPGH